jgi:hypothetical protein
MGASTDRPLRILIRIEFDPTAAGGDLGGCPVSDLGTGGGQRQLGRPVGANGTHRQGMGRSPLAAAAETAGWAKPPAICLAPVQGNVEDETAPRVAANQVVVH